MNDNIPRLMQVPEESQTRKPEELVDVPITILAQESQVASDGLRRNHKWVVRLLDGSVGMYWAPGQWPPMQVGEWFRENPGKPLYATLRKTRVAGQSMRDGSPMLRWELQQRFPSDNDAGATTPAQSLVDEVPF